MPALRGTAALAALFATGASAPLYPDQAAVLRELNLLRADPAGYAVELRRIATGYRGPYWREGDGTEHASREGAAAVVDAAAALTHQLPLAAIGPDATLRDAAHDQVEAQGATGDIGHASSAGTSVGERVRRRGGDGFVAEVTTYGMHDAADVVRSLVVDDGVAGRGHRRLLLSPLYRFAGVWCGPHAAQGTMCVIDLAAEPAGRPHVPDD